VHVAAVSMAILAALYAFTPKDICVEPDIDVPERWDELPHPASLTKGEWILNYTVTRPANAVQSLGTLVFIHGWPDHASIWNRHVQRLAPLGYRCVAINLPNYERGASIRWPDGPDMPEVVELLRATIAEAQRSASPHDKAVTLISHDWGATYSYLLLKTYPTLARGLVAMDVGSHWNPSVAELLLVIALQFPNIFAFLLGRVPHIGRPVGDFIAHSTAWLSRGPLQTRPPGAREGRSPLPGDDQAYYPARGSMGYPQFHFWRRKACGTLDAMMDEHPPPTRFLFLFGRQMPIHFYSDEWLFEVQASPRATVLGIESDHWVPLSGDAVEAVFNWLQE